MDRNKRIGTLLVMLAITLACASPVLPSVASLPTQAVGAVKTMIAGTYAAASTATAVNVTSTATLPGTPTTTGTATITVTPTATFILKTPTMYFSGGGGGGGGGTPGGGGGGGGGGFEPTYACKIMKIIPAYGSHLTRGRTFRTTWRVTNSGDVVWDRNSVDYKYSSGTPMQRQSLYDLPNNVSPGKQVDLIVAMEVPSKRGTYITTWIMQIGDQVFCSMEQKIIAD